MPGHPIPRPRRCVAPVVRPRSLSRSDSATPQLVPCHFWGTGNRPATITFALRPRHDNGFGRSSGHPPSPAHPHSTNHAHWNKCRATRERGTRQRPPDRSPPPLKRRSGSMSVASTPAVVRFGGPKRALSAMPEGAEDDNRPKKQRHL